MKNEKDIFTPNIELLMKLGSIIVHADEYLSNGGHHFDLEAFKALMENKDVQEWFEAMDKLALLPKKRK